MKTASQYPVAAIISEYNPFHNGHAWHIEATRATLGPDCRVVAIMSGNFVQRGAPAIFDKWTRAEHAVRCGANLVIELPTYYATAAAPDFAWGGVKIAEAIGIATHLSFGVEIEPGPAARYGEAPRRSAPGNADRPCADLGIDGQGERDIQEHLRRGYSYAAAVGRAKGIAPSPNRTLGTEYRRALERLGSTILPLEIPRIGQSHHDTAVESLVPSASAIRTYHKNTGTFPLQGIPEILHPLYLQHLSDSAIHIEAFETLILTCLRTTDPDQLRRIRGFREGIENRFVEAALRNESYQSLIESVKTKRYTRASLDRMLISMLLDITSDSECSQRPPSYLRILAFDDLGRAMLREIRQQSETELITRWQTSESYRNCNPHLMLDQRASALYATIAKQPLYEERTRPPFYLITAR